MKATQSIFVHMCVPENAGSLYYVPYWIIESTRPNPSSSSCSSSLVSSFYPAIDRLSLALFPTECMYMNVAVLVSSLPLLNPDDTTRGKDGYDGGGKRSLSLCNMELLGEIEFV